MVTMDLPSFLSHQQGHPRMESVQAFCGRRPKPARGDPRPTVALDRFPSDAVRLKHQDPLWPAAVTIHAPSVLGETAKVLRPWHTIFHRNTFQLEGRDGRLSPGLCFSGYDLLFKVRQRNKRGSESLGQNIHFFLGRSTRENSSPGISRFRLTLTLTCPYSLLVPFISNFLQSKWWEKKWAILLTDEETEVSPEKRGPLRKRGEEEAGKAGRRRLTPLDKGSWEGERWEHRVTWNMGPGKKRHPPSLCSICPSHFPPSTCPSLLH